MKKIIITIAVLIFVGMGIWYIVIRNNVLRDGFKNDTMPAAEQSQTASDVRVSIKNFSFNPETLTIKPGTKITWINEDTVAHTVTSDSDSILNSGTISPGESFSFTFDNAGSINYHCAIHPSMKGSIIVGIN